ncbi:hypothetical protein F5Y14DRAFT_448559 [Nemania sp. NC0429]|nr:hypothetical protein F5Y14DRAFT_448559 [Nemania sp. NC0429]
MASPKQSQQDNLDNPEWLESVLVGANDQLYINSLLRTPAIAEQGLGPERVNVCHVKAALPNARLSDYLFQGTRERLPPFDLNHLVVEHESLSGQCVCFLKLSQDEEGVGNLSQHLKILRLQCARLDIDLGESPPLFQFIVLCHVALRLPLVGRFEHLRSAYRLNYKRWVESGDKTGQDVE